jgi:hypothetical protein
MDNYGGCFGAYGSSSFVITNVTSTDTSAVYGGAISIEAGCSDMHFSNLNIINAVGSRMGGCVFHSGNGDNIRFTSSVLSQCVSRENGGGVYVKDGTNFIFSNFTIQDSSAELSGGGMYFETSSTLKLNSVLIKNCQSKRGSGGGLAITQTTGVITILDSKLVQNQADQFGGGLYISPSSTAKLFWMNSWSYNHMSTIDMSTSSTFNLTMDSANDQNGAILYFDSSTRFLSDSSSLFVTCDGEIMGMLHAETPLPGLDIPALFVPCVDQVSLIFDKDDTKCGQIIYHSSAIST